MNFIVWIAQLVEYRSEKPGVIGAIPFLTVNIKNIYSVM
jgi:hypothetical protein